MTKRKHTEHPRGTEIVKFDLRETFTDNDGRKWQRKHLGGINFNKIWNVRIARLSKRIKMDGNDKCRPPYVSEILQLKGDRSNTKITIQVQYLKQWNYKTKRRKRGIVIVKKVPHRYFRDS